MPGVSSILYAIVRSQMDEDITESDAMCIAEQWACEISFDEMDVVF